MRVYIVISIVALSILSGCNFSNKTAYYFEGNSMQPTINDQDKLLVGEDYYEENDVKTGDVIVYKTGEDTFHIKRVLGLPADIYADEALVEGITLKKNEYFLVGDNPASSKDSRHDGPITEEAIKGK